MADASAASPPVPGRRRWRWKQRLSTAARPLLTATASSADAVIQRLVGSVADAARLMPERRAAPRAVARRRGQPVNHQPAPGIRPRWAYSLLLAPTSYQAGVHHVADSGQVARLGTLVVATGSDRC